jgi:hypothetical protein
MGSKLVVSFATDGAAAEVGALRFEGFEGGPREEWKGFIPDDLLLRHWWKMENGRDGHAPTARTIHTTSS